LNLYRLSRLKAAIVPSGGWTDLGTIALAGLIIAVGLLMLAAQRQVANKRLANERRNKDEN
jgi:hypothetical protein